VRGKEKRNSTRADKVEKPKEEIRTNKGEGGEAKTRNEQKKNVTVKPRRCREMKRRRNRDIGKLYTPYMTPTQRSHSPAHSSALGSGGAVGSSEMCVPRGE
jgi:hypothetical protein